jgi:hypothetical protein
MGSSAQYWSTIPGSNQSVDPDIFSADSQSPSTVDDNIRSVMAAVAKYHKDTDGALTASGTANALTATTNQVLISGQLTGGLGILVKAANANTTVAVTFAPDGLTAQPIKRADGSALAIGSIQPNMLLDLAYAPGTSEWWAKNIPPVTTGITGVTDGSNALAGQVGEFLSVTGVATSGYSSGTPANAATLALTAGDWNVWGDALFSFSVGGQYALLAVSSVSNSLGSSWGGVVYTTTNIMGSNSGIVAPTRRFSLAASANAYLVAQAIVSSGTISTTANLFARRMR